MALSLILLFPFSANEGCVRCTVFQSVWSWTVKHKNPYINPCTHICIGWIAYHSILFHCSASNPSHIPIPPWWPFVFLVVTVWFLTTVWFCYIQFLTLQDSDNGSTQSPFVSLLSRHSQYGRWSSFGKWVWFTKSHIDLIIVFSLMFYLFILLLI